MPKPPPDLEVADFAPSVATLTDYDRQHRVTYLRLLDADAEGADWAEICRLVLCINPVAEPERARRAFDSHLVRAKWMMEQGYRHLLQASSPKQE